MSVTFGEVEPTEIEYNIKCRIKRIEKGFVDSRRRQLSADMILLLPDVADSDCQRFLTAWLPDTDDQTFEVLGWLKTPFHSPARMAISRARPHCPEQPFLMLMTTELKDYMKRYLGETVEIKIYPASKELGEDKDPNE